MRTHANARRESALVLAFFAFCWAAVCFKLAAVRRKKEREAAGLPAKPLDFTPAEKGNAQLAISALQTLGVKKVEASRFVWAVMQRDRTLEPGLLVANALALSRNSN